MAMEAQTLGDMYPFGNRLHYYADANRLRTRVGLRALSP